MHPCWYTHDIHRELADLTQGLWETYMYDFPKQQLQSQTMTDNIWNDTHETSMFWQQKWSMHVSTLLTWGAAWAVAQYCLVQKLQSSWSYPTGVRDRQLEILQLRETQCTLFQNYWGYHIALPELVWKEHALILENSLCHYYKMVDDKAQRTFWIYQSCQCIPCYYSPSSFLHICTTYARQRRPFKKTEPARVVPVTHTGKWGLMRQWNTVQGDASYCGHTQVWKGK